MRKPCENCPWRVDAPREYWDSQHFRDIWQNCQDDGLHIMQCHKSATAPETIVCQGWLRVMKTDAVGVRIALMRGQATLEEMNDASTALFTSFEEVMAANNVELPPRNKFNPER